MEIREFNEFQKDALKEIGSICVGNAATALSQLFSRKIEMTSPEIFLLSIEEVPRIVGEDNLEMTY